MIFRYRQRIKNRSSGVDTRKELRVTNKFKQEKDIGYLLIYSHKKKRKTTFLNIFKEFIQKKLIIKTILITQNFVIFKKL